MPRRRPSRVSTILHRYRTEGAGAGRQAWAVALGLFIGALPVYGFHLLLCVTIGGLFRLNRFKVYLAANISNPIVAPILTLAEIQAGAWLRTGHVYTRSTLDAIRLRGLALDLVIGSVVVGAALAMAGGLLAYAAARRARSDAAAIEVVERAAAPYLLAGIGAWELARWKMRLDPVYRRVLEDGILPAQGTVVDIGCGQGYMLALLSIAPAVHAEGAWPPGWPSPPVGLHLIGYELRPRMVARAREVLDEGVIIEERDVTTGEMPSCDAVLIFDVLHLLRRADQRALLERVRASLHEGGVLVIREANAAGGWRFRMVRTGNWFRALLQGRPNRPFEFRTADQWRAELEGLGFDVRAGGAATTASLSNFLLYARTRPAA